MGDALKNRRLSRLPIPIAGFKKTRVAATFTASPLVDHCHRMAIVDYHDDPGHDVSESPAKMARLDQKARMKASRPSAHAKMATEQPALQEVRRLSLAPRQDSLLSTPPQRKIVGRKSIAPNPYGMHIGTKTYICSINIFIDAATRRRSFTNDPNRLQVCVRKRPLSDKEMANSQDSIQCDPDLGVISIHAVRTKLDGLSKYEEEHTFKFDKIFDETVDNHSVYLEVLSPLVKYAAHGGTSTCFAYGQTGSGKTHTMFHEQFGLTYLAAIELFDLAAEQNMEVFISFYEIYQGQLMDLLRNKRKIVACEKDGVVNILGLQEEPVDCVEDLVEAVKRGLQTRVTGTTGANAQSSRSHAVLTFSLRPRSNEIFGRISFIDLAGSERGADRANVSHQTKLEGSEINKSLLALKECIRAMDLDSSRIPFRQSKLTMVLRDSFLGNSRTCMIATVSPSSLNVEHSLNTLRYADRMKETQGGGDGGGEVVTQTELRPNTRLSLWPSQMAEMKENFVASESSLNSTRTASPHAAEKAGWTVERASTPTGISATRHRLRKHLDDLGKLVSDCSNVDILDLLEEEITGLKSAFDRLS